jgi:uncharacterized DUF497 family protein
MRFEWDGNKRLVNVRKHGLDFRDAQELFEERHVIVPSRGKGTEERFLAIGRIQGRFVTVVHTMRQKTCRIISMRRARDEERRKYQELLGGGA